MTNYFRERKYIPYHHDIRFDNVEIGLNAIRKLRAGQQLTDEEIEALELISIELGTQIIEDQRDNESII